MTRLATIFLLVAAFLDAQTITTKRLKPRKPRPGCAKGAICFSGEVRENEEFRHVINNDLEFVLEPAWKISIVQRHPTDSRCSEFVDSIDTPLHGHRLIDIDISYGWTAEDEVATSPRGFRFVTNCSDLQTAESMMEIFTDEAAAKFTSITGIGRLWITASKTTHAHEHDKDVPPGYGAIEWMKFSVELVLPRSPAK